MVPRLIFYMLFSISILFIPKLNTPTIVPGRVLIRISATASARIHNQLTQDFTVQSQLGTDVYSIQIPIGEERLTAQRLSINPDIVYAQPDHIVTAQTTPNDPRYNDQWNLAHVGMPAAWKLVTDTTALPIAILDSGVAVDHPDLAEQLWTNDNEIPNNQIDDDQNGFVDDVHGWHFFQTFRGGQATPRNNGDISDPNGHGTHVSGIVGAIGNNNTGIIGITWRAQLMIVRVLDEDLVGAESDIIRGLQYAIDNGAKVINLSLGMDEPSPALAEAIAEAESQGVVVVAAAGNNSGAIAYPAAYPSVIAVGASNQQDQRADFSAYGPTLDLLAPGVDILSTWNGVPYFTRSGTSMATPHVTGIAALYLTQSPQSTPTQVRSCLTFSATDLARPGYDEKTGWGLINAARVLNRCQRPIYLPLLLK